ncbi:MAG TPA: NADH-quinone oxidoreductase subunit J [Bdellovibrionota bacterium]|nr:NADH-quinone oxidoreductase subunit J [Bdellovibrionota bacterium]
MTAGLFYLFGGAAVLFSLLVILLRNPVTSALSLVASFFAVSAIFVLLGAPFLGVIQVLVYAGAVLVLFLYVVMLLNVRIERRQVAKQRLISLGSLLLLALILAALFKVVSFPSIAPVAVKESFGSMASVGELLLGPYALVFELVSLVLLAAMIGAVILSTMRKEEERS